MATQVKYKFGNDEFDLKDYIHNLETNYQSYIASKNWNEGQKQEFKNAFDRYLTGLKDQLSNNTGRFYTDYSGAIFDNKGELSSTDDDNIDQVGSEYYYNNKGQRITTDDYNLLRKRKQKNFNTFSANRQVATYLNKIGTALREYSKQNPSSNSSNIFNLSKHGFEKYFKDQNNPAGGDFDFAPYVEKDQVGEDGVRGTSNRASYLKEQLENYVSSLGDYDFSSTVYKDKNTYLSKLRAAIENLNNGYNHEDTIALNQAGLSSKFLKDFFSTGEQQQKSEVEEAADYIAAEQKRQQDQQTLDQAAKMKAMSELDQWAKDNQFQSKYQGVLEGGDYNPQDILDTVDRDYSYIEGGDNRLRAWLNFEQLLKDIKEPVIETNESIKGRPVSTKEGYKAAMKKLRNDIAKKLKVASKYGFMKAYGDEYVIPGSEDYNNYTLMTYNPGTGEYKDQSILLNEKLREAMAYDWYKKNKSVAINENGGILQYLQEGGYAKMKQDADLIRKQREQQKQKQEQENKPKDDTRTPEQKKAGERVPKKGELSTEDKARIYSAVADIGSILASFVPGYGTAASAALGLGSTGANLIADISDDSVSGWQAAGNAGFGLLMDTVGLIPGLGATGKAGKIAKTLKYVLPTALTIWGVSENGGDAIKAANKLMNGQDLTVDDWKALSFGLQTIAGGTRAVKGNKSVNKQLKNTKEVVPYRTITAESGKTYKVNPEQFKQITSATTLDAQNKAFREAIGNTSESLGNKFKTSKWERVRHPFTSEPKTGKEVDYVNRDIDLSTMERIPYQFKVDNGQLVPRRLSNEWILQKTGSWTFGDPSINLFTRKNPLYNKPTVLQDPVTSVPQTKSSVKPGSGPNIRQLRIWSRTPRYARKQGYGRDFGIGNTRNKREIDLGIEFDKHGGVLKCYNGNTLTHIGRAGVGKNEPVQEKQDPENSKTNYNPLQAILSNPTIAYGLPRAIYDDRMNRRITDLAKKLVVPLLQKDSVDISRYAQSDLDSEMQGERNYVNFKRLARPITSDGNLQTAAQFQSEVYGQEARTAGKEKSNQVRRQYDELAWQQEKENAANRYEKEMSNMAQLWNADKTKNAFEQAYLYKKATIGDIFGQQLEYDAKVKQNENKALEDNFAKSDIHNAIIYTPNDYGANLTPNELTVWNKVLSGTDPSSLTSPGEFNSYKLALQKVSRAENDQLRKYYNVPYTRWSGKTPSTPWTPIMSKAISAKNGAKIAVAGIEAKTADAERFQKQIKECIDRNEKVIDRLSKSLQGLIKASTIK